MLTMVVRIVVALAVAILAAALIGERLGSDAGAFLEPGIVQRIVERGWSYAMLSWPFALFAIAIAEFAGIRALLYYLGAGALVAVAATTFDTGAWDFGLGEGWLPRWRDTALTTGALGGLVYWLVHGHRVGWRGADQEARHASRMEALIGPSTVDRDRCPLCGWLALLLAMVPAALVAWSFLQDRDAATGIVRKAELGGTAALAQAGVPWATLSIKDDVGEVIGRAPDAVSRASGFDTASRVLAPLVGVHGVVSKLDDRITVADMPGLAPLAGGAQVQAAEAIEARRRAEETDRRRIEEVERRLVGEQEARRKAEDDVRRLTAEVEARRKGEQDARRLVAESDGRRKAEEDTARRLASEVEARRKAEDDVRRLTAEVEARRQGEQEARRLAADAESRRKAEESQRRVVAEIEARRQAAESEAKRKAEAAGRAAAAVQPPVVAAPSPAGAAAMAPAGAPRSAGSAAEAAAEPPATAAAAGPAGACPAEQVAIVRDARVAFALGSAELPASARDSLDRLTAAVKQCDGLVLRVAGHASREGGPLALRRLSLARAARVADWLARQGVPAVRMEPVGYGGLRAGAGQPEPWRHVEFALLPPRTAGAPPPLSAACVDEIVATRLHFTNASARLTYEQRSQLDRLAAAILDCRMPAITVEGHTDGIGNTAANQRLSARRAERVRRALIERGVPATLVAATGVGASRPLATGGDAAAQARNRRVEVALQR